MKSLITHTLNGIDSTTLRKFLLSYVPFKENTMPWYGWIILIVVIGAIVGGLMTLRDTADKVELTDEQRKRVAERNAEMDAKESKDR